MLKGRRLLVTKCLGLSMCLSDMVFIQNFIRLDKTLNTWLVIWVKLGLLQPDEERPVFVGNKVFSSVHCLSKIKSKLSILLGLNLFDHFDIKNSSHLDQKLKI